MVSPPAVSAARKLVASVVDGLVERAAGRVEPLGQDVDGDVIERDGDEDLALVGAELRLDRLLHARRRSSSRPRTARTCRPGREATVAAETVELVER
jgi:hypothetical protein